MLADLAEEQHIGLHALRVKDAGGQAQDGVQVALVHQVAPDVGADAGFEQHVVGQHHGGAAAVLQAAVDVLQERQLLVAGAEGEVVAGRAAAAFGGAERRIGEDDVDLGQLGAGAAERVAQMDHALIVAFHPVQQAVHQRQPAGAGHQFHADIRVVALEGLLFLVQVVHIVGVAADIRIGGDQKAGGAGGRVLDGFAGLRLDQRDDAVDQRARGEVLAGAGFGFAGVFFQQAFIQVAEAVFRSR